MLLSLKDYYIYIYIYIHISHCALDTFPIASFHLSWLPGGIAKLCPPSPLATHSPVPPTKNISFPCPPFSPFASPLLSSRRGREKETSFFPQICHQIPSRIIQHLILYNRNLPTRIRQIPRGRLQFSSRIGVPAHAHAQIHVHVHAP